MGENLLVIDEGTTSTRAMLFAADGTCLGSQSADLTQHYPAPGLVEHDAAVGIGFGDDAYRTAGATIAETAEAVFDAADLIIASMEKAILSKQVTYDFARLLPGAAQVSCSGFGQVMIGKM